MRILSIKTGGPTPEAKQEARNLAMYLAFKGNNVMFRVGDKFIVVPEMDRKYKLPQQIPFYNQ